MRKPQIWPAVIGNSLEWYDFSLYGYLAALLAPLFFAHTADLNSLLTAFSLYAIGFVMRPLGAVFFGHYADRYGRKQMLSVAIILMGLATTLIGVLPTYANIGIWAGILLLGCRLLQGFALGGEFGGSAVYIIEQAPLSQRGLYGSLSMAGTFLGLLLGAIVTSLLQSLLTQSQMSSFGWRLPFLSSFILAGLGLYLRFKMPESTLFLSNRAQLIRKPWLKLWQNHKWALFQATLIVWLSALSFTLSFIFLPFYFQHYYGFATGKTLGQNCLCMLVCAVFITVFGYSSDKIGRKPLLLTAAMAAFGLSYPLFWQFNQAADILHGFFLQLGLSLITGLICSVNSTLLAELFPLSVRCTGFSLAYNLANALFGGTALAFLTWAIAKTDNLLMPGYYLSLTGLLVLIGLFRLKDRCRFELS